MIGAEARLKPIGGQQFARHARVFGQHFIGPGQHVQRAKRDVSKVADRRGDDIQTRSQ
jgi:hypothetical protein